MSWAPRFVIFTSYGNDSAALIQWAREEQLEDVAVVYTDTKWAASDWEDRVEIMECWTMALPPPADDGLPDENMLGCDTFGACV